ncbi:MAG: amidase [Candidatus Poribacteria bacterium]|nr:amidase [Candidatus Poribacteria bacterium]
MCETPLYFKTITEISEDIASKQLSPVEVTAAMLARIEQLDSRLHSYATVTAEQAMAAAQEAEQEINAGTYRGPLHGVPIAVKDLCFTKGIRTIGGVEVLAEHVPAFDGTVITRLAAAGAILLGKLNLTEGAMGGYNPNFDIPQNPWNPDRWTGSSSSGSGVATAAGLCFGSLGSDTGGSIRFPSAACGVVGLKPTWGRVSRYGVLALAESMDHVGPMTRSVADAGIMLAAIAGSDPNDPTSLPAPVPNMLERIGQDLRGVRIGFDEHYATHGIDVELAAAVRAGVATLSAQGAEIVEVKLPDVDEYVSVWPTLCATEAVVAHAAYYPLRRDAYGPWFQGWLDMGAKVTGAAYAKANNLRAACTGHLRRVFAEIDVLVCPSMSAPPHVVTPEVLYGPYDPRDREPKFQRFTVPFNYNGAPTLSVPCGMNSEGLPLSIQFVGKHLTEPLLCQVGQSYESATPWQDLHPDV